MDLMTLYQKFASALTQVLPLSPFRQYITTLQDADWIHWLNWVLPIQGMLNIMLAWLGAVALFYLYSLVMRWLRVIS